MEARRCPSRSPLSIFSTTGRRLTAELLRSGYLAGRLGWFLCPGRADGKGTVSTLLLLIIVSPTPARPLADIHNHKRITYSTDIMEDEKGSSGDLTPPFAQSTALGYIRPQHRKPHDPAVTFEEYHFYAQKTREEERSHESTKTNWREIVLRKKTEHPTNADAPVVDAVVDPTHTDFTHRLEITDEEWTNASRAFRTASWGACE